MTTIEPPKIQKDLKAKSKPNPFAGKPYYHKNFQPGGLYGITESTVQPWIDAHPCVGIYLNSLNSRQLTKATYVFRYCKYAKKSPEELLELKNKYDNFDAERLLDDFVRAEKGIPDSSKFNIVNTIRAFYRTNYRQLQSAAGKYGYTTKKSRAPPSNDACRKMIENCYGLMEKALIMTTTGTALARESVAELRWSHFEENWQNQEIPSITLPSEIIKGHGKGKYAGAKQVSFFTPEAKEILQEYRRWYAKTYNYTWAPNDYVFMQHWGGRHIPLEKDTVAKHVTDVADRAGIEFTVHDGRSRVQTALENVGVSNNWIRKIKGRKVAGEESPYSKPSIDKLRAKFQAALPELEFLSDKHQKVVTPQEKFASNFANILQKHPEVMDKFEQFLLSL